MKCFLIIALISLLGFTAVAQKRVNISAHEVAKYVGKQVTVTDSVYGYKRIAKAMLIYLGGTKPKQFLTIVLRGEAMAEPDSFKQSIVVASGIIIKRLNNFELVVSNPDYFLVRRTSIMGMHINLPNVLQGIMNPERRHLPLSELKSHIGEDVYVFDTISGRKAVNDSLTYLYLGGAYPNHLLTVVLKGKRANKELSHLKMFSNSCFSGQLLLIEGKPTIVITDRYQTARQILACGRCYHRTIYQVDQLFKEIMFQPMNISCAVITPTVG